MKHKKSLFNRIAAVITILFFVLSFGFIGYRIFLLHQAEKAGTANPFSTTRTDEGTSVSVISGDNPEKSIKKENPAAVLEDGSTVYTASVIAVGDNLYHKSVINSGWRESGGRPGEGDRKGGFCEKQYSDTGFHSGSCNPDR